MAQVVRVVRLVVGEAHVVLGLGGVAEDRQEVELIELPPEQENGFDLSESSEVDQLVDFLLPHLPGLRKRRCWCCEKKLPLQAAQVHSVRDQNVARRPVVAKQLTAHPSDSRMSRRLSTARLFFVWGSRSLLVRPKAVRERSAGVFEGVARNPAFTSCAARSCSAATKAVWFQSEPKPASLVPSGPS